MIKDLQQRSQFTKMILPCEIPQLDIPDVGRNQILEFFLVLVLQIISVREIYSDSLFVSRYILLYLAFINEIIHQEEIMEAWYRKIFSCLASLSVSLLICLSLCLSVSLHLSLSISDSLSLCLSVCEPRFFTELNSDELRRSSFQPEG